MSLIIILIYFIFFCYGFRIYDLPQKLDVKWSVLCGLFGLKVIMGCINLYFHNSEYISNDAHYYFVEATNQLADFHKKPGFYINEWLFNWGDIGHHLNFLNKENAVYWSDIGRLLHMRFMIVSNILSFGHEYVNVIFYNLFFFIGQLALLKTFFTFKPEQKWLFIALIFFIPSIAFWTSGIHKDGFILALIGMVCWLSIKVFANANWKNISGLVLALLFLLAFRYFYFLVFLPLYLLLIVFRNKKSSIAPAYLALSIVLISLFLFSGSISPKVNMLKIVVNKQQDFYMVKGYSDMATPLLETTPLSFIKNLPVALEHVFVQPIPQMGKKIKYDITSFDSMLVLVLLFLGIFKIKRKYLNINMSWSLLFYSIFCLTFIGYTIPNLGAMVRYESPFLCLLMLSIFSFGSFSIKKELSLE